MNRIIKIANELNQEYMGEHKAPTKEGNAPLYNLTINGIYPKDIYEGRGNEYTFTPKDRNALSIIYQAYNKPNFNVKIYRAIPKIESKEEKINALKQENKYIMKYGKPSGKLNIKEHELNKAQKKNIEFYNSTDKNSTILIYIEDKIKELESEQKDISKEIKIEPGNWVTLSLQYAKEHGISNLNGEYKIISKTVKAKDLYTDGNSLSEWGYNPS
jgi:hypothetical protein